MEHHFLLVYAGISSILFHYVVFHIACLRCIFQWIVSFGDVLSSFAIFDLIDFYQPNFIPEQNMHHVLDIILLVFSHEFFAFHWPIWSASGGRQDHVEFANSLFFFSTWETSWVRVWFLDVLTHIVFFGYMGRFGVCDGRWNISICLFFTILLTQSWFVSV